MNIFWDVKILWILFRGSHKTGLFWRLFLCILGLKVQNGNIFGGLLKLKKKFRNA